MQTRIVITICPLDAFDETNQPSKISIDVYDCAGNMAEHTLYGGIIEAMNLVNLFIMIPDTRVVFTDMRKDYESNQWYEVIDSDINGGVFEYAKRKVKARDESLKALFNDLEDNSGWTDPTEDVNSMFYSAELSEEYTSKEVNLRFREAARYGQVDTVKALLKDKRVDPTADDNYVMRCAAANGHVDMVRLLLADERVDPTADDNFVIRLAAREGHVEVVRLLLADRRVDPTAGDNFAIRLAAANGYVDVVRLLLEDGRVDPAAGDNFALCMAAANGHQDVVSLLLADGRVDPTADNNFAIRWAAKNGHLDIVRILEEHINGQD